MISDDIGFAKKEEKEEKILREIDIIPSTKQKLSESENVFYYATIDGGGGVFKSGHRYKGERAAYVVDKFLKLNLVPITIIRTVDGKEGSFQQFIPNTKKGDEVSKNFIPTEKLINMVILDFLNNTEDRHEGNILVTGENIKSPDNYRSFSEEFTLRRPVYFEKNLFSASIPEETRNKILQLGRSGEEKEALVKSLDELLNKNEVNAFSKRLEYLTKFANRGTFLSEDEYDKLLKSNKLE